MSDTTVFVGAEMKWRIPNRLAYFVSKELDSNNFAEYGPYNSKWHIEYSVDHNEAYLVVQVPTVSSKAVQVIVDKVEGLLKVASDALRKADFAKKYYEESLKADAFLSTTTYMSPHDALSDVPYIEGGEE